MKFRAAVLEESHKPLVVQYVIWNGPLDYGQVLTKNLYTTICGAQLNEIDAVKGPDKYLPHLLGHEAVAVVQDIGPGVTRVKPGDLVVLHWRPAAGILAASPKLWVNLNHPVNAGPVTTFSEKSIVSENRCTPIPDSQHNKEMCLFGCAVTTAAGVICNDAQVKIGDSVLIIGVGGVGACIAQFAHLAGASEVVSIDVSSDKLDWAAKFYPAWEQILLDDGTVSSALTDTMKEYFDVIIETSGKKEMIEFAHEIAHPEGRCITVGVCKEKVSINSLKSKDGLKFFQSHGGSCQPDRDIPRLFDMLQEGRFRLEGMIQKTVSLDNINEGIEYMRSGGVGRVLVDMRGDT